MAASCVCPVPGIIWGIYLLGQNPERRARAVLSGGDRPGHLSLLYRLIFLAGLLCEKKGECGVPRTESLPAAAVRLEA